MKLFFDKVPKLRCLGLDLELALGLGLELRVGLDLELGLGQTGLFET